MQMLDKMEELNLSQKALADRMECSQQYISKILKGSENLSLETIAKINKALGLHILDDTESHSAYALSGYNVPPEEYAVMPQLNDDTVDYNSK